MMKILVIGATGKTGRKLLELLTATEHPVTGVIRNIEQSNMITEYQATPKLNDLTENISSIAEDQDAIFFVAGSGGKDVEGVDYNGLVKTVASAVKHKVKRFLYISSLNIDKTKEQCLAELKTYYTPLQDEKNQDMYARLQKSESGDNYYKYLQMKKQAEEILIKSGLDYTILRAAMLTEDPLTRKIDAHQGLAAKFGIISRYNVALTFITALTLECTSKKIYTIYDGDKEIVTALNS